MKKFILSSIIFCLAVFNVLSQANNYRPFTMAIVKPDTATIHNSLLHLTDSVERTFKRRYYHSIKRMEEMLDFNDYPDAMKIEFEETKKNYKKQIKYLKSIESDILNFEYYELLSSYSTEVYNMYFNEYEPFSTIYEVPNPSGLSPVLLLDSLKVDYLIVYQNLHTEERNGELVLKMTTSLFSKDSNNELLVQQINSKNNSLGGLWTCTNDLTCFLINAIRESVEPNVLKIRSLQLKK